MRVQPNVAHPDPLSEERVCVVCGNDFMGAAISRYCPVCKRKKASAPRAPKPIVKPALTNRQGQIAHLLWEGRSLPEISKALHLSQGTVQQYVYAGRHRIGVASNVGLIREIEKTHGECGQQAASLDPSAPTSFRSLTPRMIEICRLIAEDKSNKEIGYLLHITEGTVKQHVSRILTRLHMRSRYIVAIWLTKTGLV